MAEDTLEMVKMRNFFYRDNYRRVILALLISIAVNVGLLFLIYYLLTHEPAPEYFATTSDGRVIQLRPLSQPNLSKQALLQWTVDAAKAAYSYNFANYREALQRASNYFTPDGWKDFLNVLNQSTNLQAVTAKKLVVSAKPTGAPQILQEGVIGGRYAWKVQIPILVSYESVSEQVQQYLTVTLLIVRVPTLNQPKGIGIAQFVAQGQ